MKLSERFINAIDGDSVISSENAHAIEDAVNFIRKYEDAEEQGRLVILPCKVGDAVYALERFCDGSKGDCDSWVTCEECEDYQQEVSERRIGTLVQAVSVIEMLGKTVFLTREEAEAALKGGRDDGT